MLGGMTTSHHLVQGKCFVSEFVEKILMHFLVLTMALSEMARGIECRAVGSGTPLQKVSVRHLIRTLTLSFKSDFVIFSVFWCVSRV